MKRLFFALSGLIFLAACSKPEIGDCVADQKAELVDRIWFNETVGYKSFASDGRFLTCRKDEDPSLMRQDGTWELEDCEKVRYIEPNGTTVWSLEFTSGISSEFTMVFATYGELKFKEFKP